MKRKIRHNLKLSLVVLLLPLAIGAIMVALLVNGAYGEQLGQMGAQRLETDNWQAAKSAFESRSPQYTRKFAYYRVKESQTLASLSEHFGVPETTLAELNPGTIATGTTIKVPPIEKPYTPAGPSNGKLALARVYQEGALLHIDMPFRTNVRAVTNFAELAEFLKPFNAIQQTGPKQYRIIKAISIDDNIRIDITGETVEKIELQSLPNNATCLCFENSSALIKDVEITTYDPQTGGPDLTYQDGRSFIRAFKSARLDMINVKTSYLGNQLFDANPSSPGAAINMSEAYKDSLQRQGGAYGVSWRIPDDMYGVELVTGWVEGSVFHRNHFGAYTYGASGMMWLKNEFSENDVYGLDPHDDSNNAWVEGNVFHHNGKHGFIVSKRCNYNVIRNNVSYSNALHGYMLHQDSVYNIMENNVAYDNTDNFAIFDSDYHTVKGNNSYNARNSHIRVNQNSANTFIENNTMYGGKRGIYLYGGTSNTYIHGNIIQETNEVLATNRAANVLFTDNIIHGLKYRITSGDRMIFGPNDVTRTVNVATQPNLRPPELGPYGTSMPAQTSMQQ